ncbi:hypothetical protein CERZMDRAFT_82812 [Cercospora zeae-maydis SCOH1-5]|uniref:Uncharacterized protein n=1 Tax=Cercospora zeae-maydis SCOH1-5 TaxID=717836 RepID=A0A6A6FNE6_9PEZI|nr:hypothetical protein CERZMDRAFT_82812 [Cercospora zeae-maydis SCOH1-5]
MAEPHIPQPGKPFGFSSPHASSIHSRITDVLAKEYLNVYSQQDSQAQPDQPSHQLSLSGQDILAPTIRDIPTTFKTNHLMPNITTSTTMFRRRTFPGSSASASSPTSPPRSQPSQTCLLALCHHSSISHQMYRKAEIKTLLARIELELSELETRDFVPKENVALRDLKYLPENRVLEVWWRVYGFVRSVVVGGGGGGSGRKGPSLERKPSSRGGVVGWTERFWERVFSGKGKGKGKKKMAGKRLPWSKAASEPTKMAEPGRVKYCHGTKRISEEAVALAGLKVRLLRLERRYREKRREMWPEAAEVVEQRRCQQLPLLDYDEASFDSGLGMDAEESGESEEKCCAEATSARDFGPGVNHAPLHCVELYDAPWSEDEDEEGGGR